MARLRGPQTAPRLEMPTLFFAYCQEEHQYDRGAGRKRPTSGRPFEFQRPMPRGLDDYKSIA